MESDIKNKCRACLCDNSNQMHLIFDNNFSGKDGEISLHDILVSTTTFEIDKEEGLSELLCENCTTIIIEFYNFKTVFKENEQQLRKLLNSNKEQDISSKSSDHEDDSNVITIKIEDHTDENNDESDVDEEFESLEYGFVTKEEAANFEPTEQFQQMQTYSCPECSTLFVEKHAFEEHITSTHPNLAANFDSNTYMEVSVVKIDSTDDTPNKCKLCSKSFQTVAEYRQHFEMHKKIICDVCGLGFVKKSYLKDHQEIHYPDKRHVCQFCNKAFRRRTVLAKHRRIHTNPRECICEVCGKGFNDKGTLKTHIMLVHSKERNHLCVICGIKFPLKATLDKHYNRRHRNNERKFFCTQCTAGYKDKSSLDRHMYVKHSGLNIKHACDECGKLYASVSSLAKHQRIAHKQ